MSKVVPFFTYVLDLSLLYLWCTPAPSGTVSPPAQPQLQPQPSQPSQPIPQAPGRVVQPTTPMVPALHQGREEGGESGGAACWVWPRGGSGRAGGPGGPPGHLCSRTGEGGLRLDGWPPAPEGRASSGVGAARPGPGPRQAPGTDGLTAGDVQQLAVDGRDPQIGRAGVEDDGEALWGRPDADLPVVLGLGGGGLSGQSAGLPAGPREGPDQDRGPGPGRLSQLPTPASPPKPSVGSRALGGKASSPA